jgi:hypothetical protein
MVQRYPGKRYHATEPPVYVQDEAADRALGPGWTDSPKTAAAVEAKPKRERFGTRVSTVKE